RHEGQATPMSFLVGGFFFGFLLPIAALIVALSAYSLARRRSAPPPDERIAQLEEQVRGLLYRVWTLEQRGEAAPPAAPARFYEGGAAGARRAGAPAGSAPRGPPPPAEPTAPPAPAPIAADAGAPPTASGFGPELAAPVPETPPPAVPRIDLEQR